MEQTEPGNLYGEITKLLEQFKLPGVDFKTIVDSRRKDIEALVNANRAALEGAQALGQKQVELLRDTLGELRSAIHEATAADASSSAKASDFAQRILQKTLQNMRELADTAYKAQSETVAVLNRRLQEDLQELRTMLQPKK